MVNMLKKYFISVFFKVVHFHNININKGWLGSDNIDNSLYKAAEHFNSYKSKNILRCKSELKSTITTK